MKKRNNDTLYCKIIRLKLITMGKYLVNIIILLITIGKVSAQNSIDINPKIFDFGVVQKWKNDTAFFELTNKGDKFMFLPIGYSEDMQVIVPKNYIVNGQTTIIKLIYFTHSRGFFRKDVQIWASTMSSPITLSIKGKIIDFHSDALMNCPPMGGDTKPSPSVSNIEIEVKDAVSGIGLSGYNLILKNNFESRLIEISPNIKVKFEDVVNGKYKVTVSLSGYETNESEIFVSRNKKKFVIKLFPLEEPQLTKEESPSKERENEIIIDNPKKEVEDDIEKLRKKYDEIYKDKKIIEKDVILVKESDKDSIRIDSLEMSNDFDENGNLNKKKYANNNIVFLIDVSGSMDKPEKLPLLKKSVTEMVKVLRENDIVTIITYAGKVKILMQTENGSNKENIYSIINSLEAKGQSYGSEGMKIAYEFAKQNFIENGNNQVILVSDGLFNSENFKPKNIYKLTKEYYRDYKILTSSIGFGKNIDAIEFLKNISIYGSGSFIQIKNESEANTALINEIMKNSLKK